MLCVEGLYKSYGDNSVLRGASFKVPRGSIYGLIGRNGAGKTTIMNILAGLLTKDAGKVTFDGLEFKEGPRTNIGYLPDLPVFYEYMKAGEYMDFLLMGKEPAERDRLLDMVEISGKTAISKMSRGMRQRLGIAATLTHDPEILLLDEPASALDPKGREDVNSILENLKSDNRVILFSTHILSDIERVCDDYGFLNNGVIVPGSDLTDNNSVRFNVIFDKPASFDEGAPENVTVEKISPVSYRFITCDMSAEEAQKLIFSMAAGSGSIVKSIFNESLSPEYLFRELNSQ